MSTNLRSDLRHAARIGRAEYRRSLRRYTRDVRRLLGLAIAVLFFGGYTLVSLPSVFFLGRAARSLASIPYVGPAATAVPVGLLAVAAFRTVERLGAPDEPDLLLTAVHPRAVVIGLIGAEIARLATWFGLPLVALSIAFALGLGALTVPLAAALVIAPVACWAAVWGYALGLAVLWLLRRLPSVRRLARAGGVLALVVLVVGSQFAARYVVEADLPVRSLLSALTVGPLVDYAALAFLGTPLERPASIGAVAVPVAALALTPVGLAAATRGAEALWFADDAAGSDDSGATSSGGFVAPRPFAWRKSGRIAWGLLVRGVRDPTSFGHLIVYLFFVAPLGTTVLSSSRDALGPLLAGAAAGFGVYLSGATFGLNPLGDDRRQLPLLLLTATSERTLVRGRLFAGLAVGGPIAALAPLATIPLGTTPLAAVALSVAGVGLCVAAGFLAPGLGAAYPIYEPREFWGGEAVVPSTLVTLVYVFFSVGGSSLGLLAVWYVVTRHLAVGADVAVALAVYVALTAGVSYGAYRYAVRRYHRYSLE